MISLRAIEESDLPLFGVWRNELKRYFRQYGDLTIVDQARWFESLSGDTSRAMWTIEETKEYEKEDERREASHPVGCCGLTTINWFDKSAEVSFFIGGDYIDKRAYETLALLIKKGFTDYGLHRLWAEVWAYDAAKADCLKDAGFKHEGTLRKAHWYNGSFHDSMYFGLVNPE